MQCVTVRVCVAASAGEYIAPERIEGALKKATAVQQVYIHGNSFESSLVAIVVPTEAELRSGFRPLSPQQHEGQLNLKLFADHGAKVSGFLEQKDVGCRSVGGQSLE